MAKCGQVGDGDLLHLEVIHILPLVYLGLFGGNIFGHDTDSTVVKAKEHGGYHMFCTKLLVNAYQVPSGTPRRKWVRHEQQRKAPHYEVGTGPTKPWLIASKSIPSITTQLMGSGK